MGKIYIGASEIVPGDNIAVGASIVKEVWIGASKVWANMAPGQELFATPGAYTWTAPEGVTEISVVCVGGGGYIAPGTANADGTGGGGLGWKNSIPVTPGAKYDLQVGQASAGIKDSWFKNGVGGIILCEGEGGSTTAGGGFTGDGGGAGGNGGADIFGSGWYSGGGGGGAGGYSGNGGRGGNASNTGSTGSGGGGGGGGGGGDGFQTQTAGGSGGGTGVLGIGVNGAGGVGGGTGVGDGLPGGQGSPDGSGDAMLYGAGDGSDVNGGRYGATGAVRIIWGSGRSFPNNAGDA